MFRIERTLVNMEPFMNRSTCLSAGSLLLGLVIAPAFAATERDEIVVTATRFRTINHALPIGVDIVSRGEIEGSTARTLPELLANRAGIHTRDTSGSPDTQIDLRGFGVTGNQNVLVLLDGQRLSEIELVSPKWSAIPLAAIERIEIVRGAGAVLYGGGASGGVINIITRSPQNAPGEAYAGVGFGSYATRELKAGFVGGTSGLGIGVHVNQFDSDNYRENNDLRQRNFEADMRGSFGATRWALKLGADDQKLRLPGARTEAQLASDRRGTSTPLNHSTRRGERVNLGVNHMLGANELNLDIGYRERVASAFFAPGFALNTAVETLSLSPRLRVPHRLLGASGSLIVGLDWDDWDYDSKNTFGRTMAEQRNRALYLQNSSQLTSATRLTVGARVQQTRNEVGTLEQSRSVRVGEVALGHALTPSASIYGRIGRSFRFATIDENNFRPTLLEPQTSRDHEFGIEYKTKAVQARAAIYGMRLANELAFIPSAPPFGANVNLPPTLRRGVELEGRWNATSALLLSANYTYAQARFRSGTFGGVNLAGKDVPLVPRQAAGLGFDWRFAPATHLIADIQYVGAQRFDNDQANTFRKMPTYELVNLKLTHEMRHWLLTASVKNLFNEKYFSYGIVSGASYSAYPAAERAYFLSAEYRFK